MRRAAPVYCWRLIPWTWCAVLSGPNAGSFAITSNTCSNSSLSDGATCTITFTPLVTAPGTYTATMKMPDNTRLGYRSATLNLDAEAGGEGTFRAVAPFRLLDTRNGTGGVSHPVGAGGTVSVSVLTLGTVQLPKGGASAIVLNVTETGATHSSFLTVYPDGAPRPAASNLNFAAGRTEANLVTVEVGGDDKIDFYNNLGSVQVIADVVGYYVADDTGEYVVAGDSYHPLAPSRVLDTRTHSAVSANGTIRVPFSISATADTHISAVAVNITVVRPAQSGYLSAWNGQGPVPTSTLNFPQGATVPNMAIVATSQCVVATCGQVEPYFSIKNTSTGSTDVLVDVIGYFDKGGETDGLRFHPTAPTRIVDTRSQIGGNDALGTGTIDAFAATTVTNSHTVALALNVTAVAPTASTYLTIWPAGGARPTASTLNPAAGQTVANSTIAGLGAGNQFDVYNQQGTTNFIADVAGTFDTYQFLPSGN